MLGASLVAQMVKSLAAVQEIWVWPLGQEGTLPRKGNGNLLQYPSLQNAMDGGVWQATVPAVQKSQTRLSNFTFGCIKGLGKEHLG